MKSTKQSLLLLLVALLTFTSTAKALTPEEAADSFIKEFQLSMAVIGALAANEPSMIACFTEGLETKVPDLSLLAQGCFIGSALTNTIKERPEAFTANDNRKIFFIKLCTEIQTCAEKDIWGGGTRTLCGHTGNYIDYLTRIQGIPASTFTTEDAARLCGEALN